MPVKSEVSNWKCSTFLENKNYKFSRNDILNILTEEDIDEAYKIISDWENYAPTPLLLLDKKIELLSATKLDDFVKKDWA